MKFRVFSYHSRRSSKGLLHRIDILFAISFYSEELKSFSWKAKRVLLNEMRRKRSNVQLLCYDKERTGWHEHAKFKPQYKWHWVLKSQCIDFDMRHFTRLSIAILSNAKVRNKLEWSHPQTKEGKISLVSLWLMPCMCVQRFVLRQVWAYHNRKKHNSKERWKLIFMMKYEKTDWDSLNFGWGCFYEELISDCEHLITLYLI